MVFDFYIGGYFHDHSYRILLNGNTLHISDYLGLPDPAHALPVSVRDNEHWQKLVAFLKSCGWKKRYDSDILDGTQWELKVKWDGINISSYGSNAYPADFDEFLALLNSVVGVAGINIAR